MKRRLRISETEKRYEENIMKRIFGRKEAERPKVTARIITDYDNAEKAIEDGEALLYIEGDAYDILMEMVERDESLCKWVKGLGRFYIGPDALHMLFGTLAVNLSGDVSCISDYEEIYSFAQEFSEKGYQNYKARNNKDKSRFELIRIE